MRMVLVMPTKIRMATVISPPRIVKVLLAQLVLPDPHHGLAKMAHREQPVHKDQRVLMVPMALTVLTVRKDHRAQPVHRVQPVQQVYLVLKVRKVRKVQPVCKVLLARKVQLARKVLLVQVAGIAI